MVRRLHAAGIEVMLDVVYNHTAEGDERGPTLSWRGLDNASWYRLPHGHARALRELHRLRQHARHPPPARAADGDGQPALLGRRRCTSTASASTWPRCSGRGDHGFERDGAFFKARAAGPGAARREADRRALGHRPRRLPGGPAFRAAGWSGTTASATPRAPSGWAATARAANSRCGWPARRDLFQPRRRSPAESVNYVVSHDGFTLADLVSYDLRHNEANGEGNRDGHGHNLSWNCGLEGPTDDPEVQRPARAPAARAAGHAAAGAGHADAGRRRRTRPQPGRQQQPLLPGQPDHLDRLGARRPVADRLHRPRAGAAPALLPLGPRWYTGLPDRRGRHDLAWLRRTGEAMTPEHWNNRMSRILGAWIGAPGRGGAPLLLLVNARDDGRRFRAAAGRLGGRARHHRSPTAAAPGAAARRAARPSRCARAAWCCCATPHRHRHA